MKRKRGPVPKHGVRMISITVTLPPSVVEELDVEADQLSVSRSELIYRKITETKKA
jgi:metal-responsive CopG/Arc/MetJ family transcriptional regulator